MTNYHKSDASALCKDWGADGPLVFRDDEDMVDLSPQMLEGAHDAYRVTGRCGDSSELQVTRRGVSHLRHSSQGHEILSGAVELIGNMDVRIN